MIEFRQVTKRYSRFVTALDGINLTFEKGEFAFITGPSGAGKSSLLKLLYAAERPTSGDVLVEGRSVSRLHPASVPFLRRNMGIVFQDFKLLPRRTVRENVSLALEVCGVPPKQTRRRVMETIERVGIAGLEDRLPGELSGGEQQRAAIARAIVGKPTIILADEPTGNLDESMSHDIFELLSSICRQEGATILVATHDMAEVALWPFRQVRLWESRIEADRPALWQPWEHYPTGGRDGLLGSPRKSRSSSSTDSGSSIDSASSAPNFTPSSEELVGSPKEDLLLVDAPPPPSPEVPTEDALPSYVPGEDEAEQQPEVSPSPEEPPTGDPRSDDSKAPPSSSESTATEVEDEGEPLSEPSADEDVER